MRIGLVMEEILNPRMKASSNVFKLFKTLNNTYIQEVFAKMDEADTVDKALTEGGAHEWHLT